MDRSPMGRGRYGREGGVTIRVCPRYRSYQTRKGLRRIKSLAGSGARGVPALLQEQEMTLFIRLFLIGSIAVTGSLALAAAVTAAGGGGGLPPGNYTFTHTLALAQFGPSVSPNLAPQFVIQVDRNHSEFRPITGPHSVTDATTVTIQISTATINGSGCFTIPASDFTVSSDLQSAALHSTLTTPCPSGGGGGLPDSIRLDVTWSGTGIVGITRDANSFDCAGGTINRVLFGRAAGVTASGAVSAPSTGTLLALSPADQGTDLRATNTHMNITGAQLASCAGLQVL
jgi:hypothetical protein